MMCMISLFLSSAICRWVYSKLKMFWSCLSSWATASR